LSAAWPQHPESERRAPHVLVSGVVLGQPMGGVRRHSMELLPRVAALLAEHGGSLAVLEGRTRIAFDLPRAIERIASDVPAEPVLARARAESAALRAAIAAREKSGRPIDLVHTAHLPAPRGLAIPFSITIHDLRGLDARVASFARRRASSLTLAAALRRARAVITVSRSVRDELIARLHARPERMHVVANAADHFEPRARHAGERAPIYCIGHLEPRKNIDVVLRALALDRELPPLVLAGAAKAGEDERLRRLASELGVAGRVTFRGAFDEAELAPLYAHASCVVLASFVEGFGIGALEAQRARVPLAVASSPALLEVTGGRAPSFDPNDAGACAQAVRRALASSREELERAAANAASYTWDASARAWFEVWRSIAR
jgi:glycosyltransferase involved in cell wall biosynthesis